MNLASLGKTITTGRRRLGQGHGSGRGKTSGRGTKGQNARNKVPSHFEGGAVPLTKRLPFLRGKGRNKPFKAKPIAINVGTLNTLPKGSQVTLEVLIKHKIIKIDEAKKYGVKILGDGTLSVALAVNLPTSKGAQKKIEQAGGSLG